MTADPMSAVCSRARDERGGVDLWLLHLYTGEANPGRAPRCHKIHFVIGQFVYKTTMELRVDLYSSRITTKTTRKQPPAYYTKKSLS